MIWQETPYTIPLLAVSALSIGTGIYIWFHYRSPMGRTGAVTILAATEWIGTYALRLAGGDLPTKVFWGKMQYPGIVILPVAWLAFAVLYTGREKWLTRYTVAGLSLVPAITLLLVLTNERHELIWSSFTINASGPLLVAETESGLGLKLFMGYAYALFLFGVLLFFVLVITCPHSRYRRQTGILLAGVMIPWIINAFAAFGFNLFPHLNPILVALAMTNLVVAFNIFYFRLGDVVPLAREMIIESMHDSVIILDTKGRIVDLNPSAQQLMGIGTESIGNPIGEVWPVWSTLTGSSDITEGGKEIVLDREQRIYDVSISPLVDWRDRPVSRVVVLRDVTDRKRSEKIKQSLKEKEILLREIHHRVKNNIQVISSLLNLQARYIEDETYVQMLKESQNRIRSMALIHEKLYQSENLADVDFNEYITDLVYSVFRSYGVNTHDIALTIKVEDVSLSIDTAIPCGLIINELVSNCLKHAFPDEKGEITITLRPVNGDIELMVSDNGRGIPEDVDMRTTQSLGLHLVTILAEDQLNGKIDMDRNGGTTVRITFKE